MIQDFFPGFREVSQRIVAFIPTLVGAGLLLLAGWLVGRFLSYVSRRLVRSVVNRLARHPSLAGPMETSGTAAQAPDVIGGFVFWVVFMFFVAAALETLGLPVVTASLSRVAYYLPNVLAALIVVFAGVIAGKVIGGAVARTASSAGMAFASAIGGTVRGTVILVAGVVAVEQLGIQANVLVVIVAVIVGATLTGVGLAFGLGARTAVSNIIASHYVAQAYRVGQTVRVGAVEGKIVQATPNAVFIATHDGRVMVPASHFNEMTSVLVTDVQS